MRSSTEYASIEWSDIGPPLVLRQLRTLEAVLELPLPDDYVSFLRAVNGGIPSKPFFRLGDHLHDWDWVVELYACTESRSRSWLSIQEAVPEFSQQFNDNAVPIGTCASDGYLALRLARTRHHVWFFSVHEDRVIDLAPSFSAFLGRLKDSAPDDAF